MRYIFLDTESSNCFDNIYKLCEYGFVVADENLNELPGGKKDVVVCPGKGREARLHLTGRKGGRDVVLAHDRREYEQAPTFDDHYENLRFLLVQKDARIFLWAGENDIQAILDNCKRYGLPKISFASYDVQILYRKIMQPKQTPSLETALEELSLSDDDIVAHRPDDDSLMTLMVLKALCEKEGETAEKLIKRCPECRRDSVPAYLAMMRRREAKIQKRITDEKKKARLKPYNDELNSLFVRDAEENDGRDKLFALSAKMKRNVEQTLPLVKKWIGMGYGMKRGLAVCYLVACDMADASALTERLDTNELQIVTKQEFDDIVHNEMAQHSDDSGESS